MSGSAVQKLIDKGFDGADIHFFLQRFGIGSLWLMDPPAMYASSEMYKMEKERRLREENEKWELASIAADHEKHK